MKLEIFKNIFHSQCGLTGLSYFFFPLNFAKRNAKKIIYITNTAAETQRANSIKQRMNGNKSRKSFLYAFQLQLEK